jgi:molybdenum cofactor guanylyltransferase
MTGIVLAGGKSSRMGVEKALLNLDGNTIIDKILYVYKRIFQNIIIVTNSPKKYKGCGAKLTKDIVADKGPLGGIYTGLLESKDEYCFVAACDMPFINEELIRYIISMENYDVVVPVLEGKFEPLFALYSKSCLKVLKKQLEEDKLSIADFLLKVNIKEVKIDEIRMFDKQLLSLININTPEDFRAASIMLVK